MSLTLGLVTARQGSKGLPGKHLLDLGSKPVLAWTIEAAQEACTIDTLLVSTDGEDIEALARRLGADVPFRRPTELARDDSPHVDVVMHALDWLREHRNLTPNRLFLLQPTSPFRTAADIDAAAALYDARRTTSLFSVSPARAHPWLTYSMDADDQLTSFVPVPPGYHPRQSLPPAWEADGAIFIRDAADFRINPTFFPTGSVGYRMPAGHGLQIDTIDDLEYARAVLGRASRK